MKHANVMRWLRVVVVSDWVLWAIVGVVVVVWLAQWSFVLWFRVFAAAELTEHEQNRAVVPAHVAAAILVAFVYGAGRAFLYHPVLNKPYGRWLATTPWRYPEPLPLGPIRLVWQDAVVIGLLVMLALLPPWKNVPIVAVIPLAFLAGYCLLLSKALFRLEFRTASVVYAIIAGCALLAFSYPPAFILVAAILIGVSHLAIGGLQEFPYSRDQRDSLGLSAVKKPEPVDVFLTIAPQTDHSVFETMSATRAAVLSLIAGWLMFCVASLPNSSLAMRTWLLIQFGVCFLSVIAQLVVYITNRLPPISIAGRFATRTYLIPGYDQVFSAPLAALGVAAILPGLLILLGVWPSLAMAISTSVSIWLLLSLPPNFEQWYYTGHFHMTTPRVLQKKHPQVKAGR